MKKILVALLSLAMVASMTACGGGSGSSQGAAPSSDGAAASSGDSTAPAETAGDGANLKVWCWDVNFNIAAMNKAKEIYTADHPDISIDVQEVRWDDIQTRLITAFASNDLTSLPDIALIQNMAARKNISLYPDQFVELTNDIDYDNFAPYVVNFSTYEGKKYAVPFDSGATGAFLRTDILEQAGQTIDDYNDITWDQFIENGKVVLDKTGIPLISAEFGSADIIDTMMSSCGQWYFKDDNTPYLVGNEAMKEAIGNLIKLKDSGVLMEVSSWDEYVASMNNGTVAGTINGIWIVGSIKAQPDQSGKWAMAKTPMMKFSGATTAGTQGGSSWYVLQASDHQAAAIDFLKNTFGSNVDFYSSILSSTGAVATYSPAAASPAYTEPDEFFGGQPLFSDILKQADLIPRFDYGTFVYEARDSVRSFLVEAKTEADIDGILAKAEEQTITQMS